MNAIPTAEQQQAFDKYRAAAKRRSAVQPRLSGYPLYTIRRDEECGCCEGKGTVPPAGNRPYFDREEVLCVECDGTGEV